MICHADYAMWSQYGSEQNTRQCLTMSGFCRLKDALYCSAEPKIDVRKLGFLLKQGGWGGDNLEIKLFKNVF